METEVDRCRLYIDSLGYNLDRWSNYTFRSDFLTPADTFSFTVGDPDIPQGVSGKLAPGMKVSLMIDERRICTGYIDEVTAAADRSSGTVIQIGGRDVLGDVVDSSIDPYMTFSPDQSLHEVMIKVLQPFGLGVISTDNIADRSIRAGNQFGEPKTYPKGRTSKKPTVTRQTKAWDAKSGAWSDKTITIQSGQRSPKQRITREAIMWDTVKNTPYKGVIVLQEASPGSGGTSKRFLNYQTKPYPHEGAYEFLNRLAKREGLHIWAKADGSGVVLGKPDFEQEPIYNLVRLRGPQRGTANNILSGAIRNSRAQQPSVIIAGARGGGGDFPRSTLRCIMVNELVSLNEDGELVDGVKEILSRFPTAYRITAADFDGGAVPRARNPYPRAKPLFLMDQEANNMEQLINFTKREMAARQAMSLECAYVVAGHSYYGKTWTVDTAVHVSDDVANIHETMWIKSVAFAKSRSAGTTTTLGLIRPNTLRL